MNQIRIITAKIAIACSLAFSFITTPPAIITASVALVATQSACGPKKIGSVAEAAKDIGGGTRDVIKAVRSAWEQKLITTEQKDRLADLLAAIGRGGQKGVDVIAALQASGVDEIPKDKAALLNKVFSDEVISPFLQLLTELGKLSDESSSAIRAALISLRAAILLLSSRIGRTDVIAQIRSYENA